MVAEAAAAAEAEARGGRRPSTIPGNKELPGDKPNHSLFTFSLKFKRSSSGGAQDDKRPGKTFRAPNTEGNHRGNYIAISALEEPPTPKRKKKKRERGGREGRNKE